MTNDYRCPGCGQLWGDLPVGHTITRRFNPHTGVITPLTCDNGAPAVPVHRFLPLNTQGLAMVMDKHEKAGIKNPYTGHPELRRDNVSGTVVMRDGKDVEYPWVVLWAPNLEWGRCADELVMTWPFLTQTQHSDEWTRQKLDEGERCVKALRKENGRLSQLVGDLRAQLARERERRKEAGRKAVDMTAAQEYAALATALGLGETS